MSRKKKYTAYRCRDCEIDFLVYRLKGRIFCPCCGETIYVENVTHVWLERSVYYKRPYTPEEDEIILAGKQAGYTEHRIAESLPGRTQRSVQQRWSRIRDLYNR